VEFLLITESKLKMILTSDELAEYSLHTLIGGRDTPSSRRGFWQILESAKTACGFDPAGDKVLIQFYPMGSGGCEVFVTKLGILSASAAKLVTRSEHVTTLSRRTSFYIFGRLSDLVEFCRTADDGCAADAYICEGGGYCLSIVEYAHGDEECELPRLSEFARRLSTDEALYVSEHCDKIIEGDAIGFFANFPE
jgi:negative regulator of genetic competence, sporulation and motility